MDIQEARTFNILGDEIEREPLRERKREKERELRERGIERE